VVATITASPDGPLALCRGRLDDAVAALADPHAVACNGAYRWADPVYTAMRLALRGVPIARRGLLRPVLPCRLDALQWLIEVDRVVASWEPDAKGTLERLHQLAGRGWRPQDCAIIDCYTGRIEGWVLVAAELLADTPKVVSGVRLSQLRITLRVSPQQRRGGAAAGVAGE
jgi:hypothetical protein